MDELLLAVRNTLCQCTAYLFVCFLFPFLIRLSPGTIINLQAGNSGSVGCSNIDVDVANNLYCLAVYTITKLLAHCGLLSLFKQGLQRFMVLAHSQAILHPVKRLEEG